MTGRFTSVARSQWKAKIQVTLSLLTDKATSLDIIDKEIYDAVLDSNSIEEEMIIEVEAADEYKTRFETAKLEVQRALKSEVSMLPQNGASGSAIDRPSENSRNFKWPKIELKQFNGDPKEWLKFLGIFNKVHEDASISEVEKFQYLSKPVNSWIVTRQPPQIIPKWLKA